MHEEDKKMLEKAGYNATMLKLGDYKHDKDLSLEDFIRNFLSDYNRNYNTLRTNGIRQTWPGHSRSLGDIFRITSYYYPEVRLKEVFAILKSFDDLVGHICNDIERRVYEVSEVKNNWYLFDVRTTDEFGFTLEGTKSKYETV